MPLFDRLVEGRTESGRPAALPQVLNAGALREAVRQDLSRLLNTRSALRGSLRQLAEGTVLDYGLPDFSSLTPASDADRNLLASLVARAVAAHEPRLVNTRAVVRPDPANPKAVYGILSGSLRIGAIYEPVTFQMTIEIGSQTKQVSLA